MDNKIDLILLIIFVSIILLVSIFTIQSGHWNDSNYENSPQTFCVNLKDNTYTTDLTKCQDFEKYNENKNN